MRMFGVKLPVIGLVRRLLPLLNHPDCQMVEKGCTLYTDNNCYTFFIHLLRFEVSKRRISWQRLSSKVLTNEVMRNGYKLKGMTNCLVDEVYFLF